MSELAQKEINRPGVSVIIPTYNEQYTIERTVKNLQSSYIGADIDEQLQIIVADGGSSDSTGEICSKLPVQFLLCGRKGRAAQMNQGAELANYPILYFLHSDTIVPTGWNNKVVEGYLNRAPAGCFQLRFDHNHPLLRLYAWFTKFQRRAFRFGDQSVYVDRAYFEATGGFREDHTVMEDNEFMWRAFNEIGFAILDDYVITSARRYQNNGIVKLQIVFGLIYYGYQIGLPQKRLVQIYKTLIRG